MSLYNYRYSNIMGYMPGSIPGRISNPIVGTMPGNTQGIMPGAGIGAQGVMPGAGAGAHIMPVIGSQSAMPGAGTGAQGVMPGAGTGAQGVMPGAGTQPIMAFAEIKGGPLAPQIRGIVRFIDVQGGTWVVVNVTGLPKYMPGKGKEKPIGPHGFHIHENGNCEVGDPNNPFTAAGEHWNPTNQPHGNHAGDFPVLFSNNGMAAMAFFTNKFKPLEVVGKAVIIHQNPDDFQTQPAGGAGKRLACGIIKRAH